MSVSLCFVCFYPVFYFILFFISEYLLYCILIFVYASMFCHCHSFRLKDSKSFVLHVSVFLLLLSFLLLLPEVNECFHRNRRNFLLYKKVFGACTFNLLFYSTQLLKKILSLLLIDFDSIMCHTFNLNVI